ncbi:osmotically inducible protein OsmC [Sphingobium sp. B2D3A]|uniref:OsmC family protein n=1 Tax=unclassified Sphingobium TaxID=2611147 RepID=UPI0022241A6B|nr:MULTISPECIES: OsmC family protein [unclassified Sphingobium]MCW2338925.1 osmotically inducible protein OsmC [Sphingobium sp. B2D3A]MCW2349691.1 osmotically inducible protein OsmC [Sphingobium sp. B12D2B]MCW2367156.1 osmotically inducible protein OsmC [Sphingobium sp. B7D2B]MCW2368795.1 osmotically inducible protein OsmC [Sphingobium sp. B11D3D]MCW2382494.1 osmotically inducible protein OsmC [Sphingobium sp. B2D3B]
MTTRTASAQYEGMGKAGKGRLTTQSGVLKEQPYGFGTRFGDEPGTNPEELIAAAHAGCFTMALSFALERAGYADGSLDTKASVKLEQGDGGFTITRSDLVLEATVPGIDPDEFARIAEEAKKTCPVSKLLNAEVTLEHRLS